MKKLTVVIGVAALVSAGLFAQELASSPISDAGAAAGLNVQNEAAPADDGVLSAQEISKSIEEVDGITSVVGKDLYAWFVYRNNSLTEPLFISRKSMVEQFMPVKEDANEAQERVNWDYIKEQIKIIKTKYYSDLNISFNEDNSGLTLSKSKPIMLDSDKRYVLVTANI